MNCIWHSIYLIAIKPSSVYSVPEQINFYFITHLVIFDPFIHLFFQQIVFEVYYARLYGIPWGYQEEQTIIKLN